MIVHVLYMKEGESLEAKVAERYPHHDLVVVTDTFERFHAYECGRRGQCLPLCYDARIVRVHEYTGCVLESREENWHDDSDFYALVWDEAEQRVKRVDYATTRFAGGGAAYVDATEEVRAKAYAWLAEYSVERARERAERTAADPSHFGRTVKVVRGRKIAKGTVGHVVRVSDGRFGTSVLLEIDGQDQRVWTAARNVEVVDPQAELDEDGVRASVLAYRPSFASVFSRCSVVG